MVQVLIKTPFSVPDGGCLSTTTSETLMPLQTYRFRTRGSYRTTTWIYTAYDGAGSTSGSDSFKQGTYETMGDYVTKGFKKIQGDGGVLMNAMNRSVRSKLVSASSFAHIYRNGYPNQWYKYSGEPRTAMTHNAYASTDLVPAVGSFILPGSDVSSLETEVSTRCLSEIGRASTDTWENLAESNKTLSMMWNPLGSWFRFERKARAASQALSAANAWLMYRYGIRPLVGSVNDIMKAVEKGIRTERVTTRARASVSVNRNNTSNVNYLGVPCIRNDVDTESIECRAMSLDEVYTDWRYQYGFDAKSLLTLPWNLVSYSFVADWFLNIGDLIGAFGQTFQPASLGRCLSTTRSATRVSTSYTTAWVSGYTLVTPQNTLIREDLFEKSRVPGLRSPGIVVKSDFRLDNLTRLGDAVALVGQQILSRFLRK